MKKGLSNTSIAYAVGFILIALLLLNSANALDELRVNTLKFQHLMVIEKISTDPISLLKGSPGTLKIIIRNTGTEAVNDIRVRIELPVGVAPLNDVNEKKLAYLDAGATTEVDFAIIAYPKTTEGVYTFPVSITYLNYIGDERIENLTASLVVRGNPKPMVEIKTVDIYKGHELGTLTVKVVNSQIADMKFLTVSLGDSSQYDILDYSKEYVGDLNSDDFQEVTFNIKIHTDAKGQSPNFVNVPITLNYADSFNQKYAEEFALKLPIRTSAELGKQTSYVWVIVVVIVIVLFVAYRVYKSYRKRQKRLQK